MQSAEALSYWQDKIGSSPVVISWLRMGFHCFHGGSLLAAQQTPKYNNSESTSNSSRFKDLRGKGVDVRAYKEREDITVSNSWNKWLDKAWDVYRDFCEVMDLRVLPSE
ncbi:25538_t:CDS:2, partial [Racocetra persica]